MEDLQIALNSARVDQRNQGLWVRSWHIGQTLQALIVDKTPSKGTLLRVDGQQLVVPADIPAQKGAKLMLQVAHMHPAPVLKLIQVINPASAPVVHFAALSELAQKLNRQSRTLISQQGRLDTTISALLGLKKTNASKDQMAWIQSLEQLIPASADLNGREDVERVFSELGGFASQGNSKFVSVLRELARLQAATAVETKADQKSEIAFQIKQALAKIALNQLAGLQSREQGESNHFLDLPIRINEELVVAQVCLAEDVSPSTEEGDDDLRRWQLWCQLHLSDAGKVVIKICIEEQASLLLFAEDPSLRRRMRESLAQLSEQLGHAGVQLSALRCSESEIEMPTPMSQFSNLLDEKA